MAPAAGLRVDQEAIHETPVRNQIIFKESLQRLSESKIENVFQQSFQARRNIIYKADCANDAKQTKSRFCLPGIIGIDFLEVGERNRHHFSRLKLLCFIIQPRLLSPAFRKFLKLGGLRRLIRPISPRDGVNSQNTPGWRAFSGIRKPAFILRLSII